MKEWSSKWNPFNSDKLMAHVYRWKEIQRGKTIPPPVLVTIDPTNVCNLKCIWCNSKYLRDRNNKQLSEETMKEMVDFLKDWKNNNFGLEAVCIAGGGEPTLHKGLGKFIERLTNNGIKVGVVTNGTNMEKHLDYLAKCHWVGVSVDAGTKQTYKKLKGENKYHQVIKNIKKLVDRSRVFDKITEDVHWETLGESGQGHGVSYKYLLHPDNVREVYKAAEIAKKIGCRNMHIRPFGNPWDRKLNSVFSYGDIEEFKDQLKRARTLEDKDFRIFGVTHKFDGNFNKANDFKNCYAIFMTADFLPPTSTGKFNFGVCCDRRGDNSLTLEDLNDFKDIKKFWGSKKHWKMFDKINPKKCPRCTYQPQNQIYENVIMEDNTTYEFV